jgi:hypothetical protein
MCDNVERSFGEGVFRVVHRQFDIHPPSLALLMQRILFLINTRDFFRGTAGKKTQVSIRYMVGYMKYLLTTTLTSSYFKYKQASQSTIEISGMDATVQIITFVSIQGSYCRPVVFL